MSLNDTPSANRLHIGFFGLRNAGKSSVVNAVTGQDLAVVSGRPGTTTDPVDTPFTLGERSYVLVDTAGIRRKAKIDADIEKIAVTMAIRWETLSGYREA